MEEKKVNDTENNNLDEKEENFSFTYKINPEYTGFALSRYFKNYVNKRNIGYTAVFSVIMILYIIEIVRYPEKWIFWALAAICAALILWLWLKLKTFKSKTVDAAIATKDDVYECKVYDDFMRIKITEMVVNDETGERVDDAVPTRINFKTDFVLVEKHEKFFLMFVNKEMTFIIPKEGTDDTVISKLDAFFSDNCGENYIDAAQNN